MLNFYQRFQIENQNCEMIIFQVLIFLHSIVNVYRFNTTISSAWTVSSPIYARRGNAEAQHYYEAFEVTVPSAGSYVFKCDSSIDSYGYLYSGSFSPASPDLNMIAFDDDAGGSSQFQITADLQSDVTYILVATTYSAAITGPFSVTASGFMRVNFVPTNYMTTSSVRTTRTNGK